MNEKRGNDRQQGGLDRQGGGVQRDRQGQQQKHEERTPQRSGRVGGLGDREETERQGQRDMERQRKSGRDIENDVE